MQPDQTLDPGEWSDARQNSQDLIPTLARLRPFLSHASFTLWTGQPTTA